MRKYFALPYDVLRLPPKYLKTYMQLIAVSEGKPICLTQKELAKALETGLRTLKRHLYWLESVGLLRIMRYGYIELETVKGVNNGTQFKLSSDNESESGKMCANNGTLLNITTDYTDITKENNIKDIKECVINGTQSEVNSGNEKESPKNRVESVPIMAHNLSFEGRLMSVTDWKRAFSKRVAEVENDAEVKAKANRSKEAARKAKRTRMRKVVLSLSDKELANWSVGNFLEHFHARYYEIYPHDNPLTVSGLTNGGKGSGQMRTLLQRLVPPNETVEVGETKARERLKALIDHAFDNVERIMPAVGLRGTALSIGILAGYWQSFLNDMDGVETLKDTSRASLDKGLEKDEEFDDSESLW